ncbi:MAG: hypothetical protein ACWA42_02255 [Lutibacter sp.]
MNKVYTYENVQIGNFLISMGYYLNELNIPLQGTINLLQQTPGDYEYGDIFGGLNGKFFLLEFKRDGKHLEKELDKKQRLNLHKEIMENPEKYKSLSIKCHLMGYPNFNDNNMLEYNFEPYIQAIQLIEDNRYEKIKSAKDMIGKLIYGGNDFGCDYVEIKEYIKLMQRCAETKESGSMSGVMFNYDKEKGMTSYSYDNLNTLSKAMNIGMSQDLSNQLDRGHIKQIGEQNFPTISISKGPSM